VAQTHNVTTDATGKVTVSGNAITKDNAFVCVEEGGICPWAQLLQKYQARTHKVYVTAIFNGVTTTGEGLAAGSGE
jgi:hypothetical protein